MAAPTDKQRLKDLEEALTQVRLDLATLAVEQLSQSGLRPSLAGIIQRNDPERSAA